MLLIPILIVKRCERSEILTSLEQSEQSDYTIKALHVAWAVAPKEDTN